MMEKKEYIERGVVLEKLRGYSLENPSALGKHSGAVEVAMYAIEQLPAADVVEVVHGEWIIKTDYKTPVSHAYIRKEKLYICPYCAKDYRKHMNFCGNCGAKMDGGNRNADA